MNILEEMFASESLKYPTTKLVAQKAEERGYSLTDERIAAIEEQVANSDFLLTLRPNIDRLSVSHILSTLAEEIGNTLLSIQRSGEEGPQP
jgi:hypothetical protein